MKPCTSRHSPPNLPPNLRDARRLPFFHCPDPPVHPSRKLRLLHVSQPTKRGKPRSALSGPCLRQHPRYHSLPLAKATYLHTLSLVTSNLTPCLRLAGDIGCANKEAVGLHGIQTVCVLLPSSPPTTTHTTCFSEKPEMLLRDTLSTPTPQPHHCLWHLQVLTACAHLHPVRRQWLPRRSLELPHLCG